MESVNSFSPSHYFYMFYITEIIKDKTIFKNPQIALCSSYVLLQKDILYCLQVSVSVPGQNVLKLLLLVTSYILESLSWEQVDDGVRVATGIASV